jgi:hypothetical protein
MEQELFLKFTREYLVKSWNDVRSEHEVILTGCQRIYNSTDFQANPKEYVRGAWERRDGGSAFKSLLLVIPDDIILSALQEYSSRNDEDYTVHIASEKHTD